MSSMCGTQNSLTAFWEGLSVSELESVYCCHHTNSQMWEWNISSVVLGCLWHFLQNSLFMTCIFFYQIYFHQFPYNGIRKSPTPLSILSNLWIHRYTHPYKNFPISCHINSISIILKLFPSNHNPFLIFFLCEHLNLFMQQSNLIVWPDVYLSHKQEIYAT